MRMQRSLLASCAPLVLSWNQPQIISHLLERPGVQMHSVTPSSTAITAFRRGIQKMQVWSEHMCPRWSALERLHLMASEPWEGSFNISYLTTLMSASLTLLRCMARGSLQGVTMLCQK